MKKFLKENWFKIVIAVFLFFAGKEVQPILERYMDMLGDKQIYYSVQYRSEVFNRKVKCQNMVADFKRRYNNTVGGNYNKLSNTCNIKYSSAGKEKSASMGSMSDN